MRLRRSWSTRPLLCGMPSTISLGFGRRTRTISGYDLRLGTSQTGHFRLRGGETRCGGARGNGLRHHHRWRPGLMQAANEGAATSNAQSIRHSRRSAVRAGDQFVCSQAFEHRTFFTRLHQFVLTSDAFVVAPGGIGTVLETTMIWQLLQVRHLRDTPLIFVGQMWPGLGRMGAKECSRSTRRWPTPMTSRFRSVSQGPTRQLS